MAVARCFLGRTLTERQEETLILLCEGAAEQWRARLRDGLTPEDCRGTFLTACAWTALAHMAPALEAGAPAPRSFTAGDLSVSLGTMAGEREQGAARLARLAEELMTPYTRDGGFSFLGVAG